MVVVVRTKSHWENGRERSLNNGTDEWGIVIVAVGKCNCRRSRDGEFLDTPLDPQHKAEDLMDALRGGIRDAMPEGHKAPPDLRTISARRLF